MAHYSRFGADESVFRNSCDNAGLISRTFFYWVNRLLDKGVERQLLSSDDLYELPRNLKTNSICNRMKETTRSIQEQRDVTYPRLSLFTILHKCYSVEFYSIGILKFISDVMGFASPLLLNKLLKFIQNPTESVEMGYLYACGIFASSLISGFFIVHFSYRVGVVGLKLRASAMSRIYEKSLYLSHTSASHTSIGEIVNHITTDVDRIINSCSSFHAVWSIPLQVVVVLYLLYTQLGLAFLAGVLFSIILIPINKIIANMIGALSVKMMAKKDDRVKITTELITGIRTIKLHVWESYFMTKILRIRSEEMKYLKYRKYLDAGCVYFWAATPVVISVLTFSTYVYLGGVLDSALVFTSIALLNMLISPLNSFPWVLNGIIEAWISLKRIQNFLDLEEIEPRYFLSASNVSSTSDVDIIIKNGSFGYSLGSLCLSSINFTANKGNLMVITGPVGSGKSSLLRSMLGEIKKFNGKVYLNRRDYGVAYVDQILWLQQSTIRENILFAQRYEKNHYLRVLESCALEEDLRQFENGDSELIGENGVTLSGGQRARVALARAVYQDKHIYLLDDVLSAVDQRVAAHIIERCICGILREKTRIIVTHNVQLISRADAVFVVNNGTIVKQGSPKDILPGVLKDADGYSTRSVSSETEDSSEYVVEGGQIEREHQECGAVSISVYYRYCKAVGHTLTVAIVLSVLFMQISRNAVDVWISEWISLNNSTDRGTNKRNIFDSDPMLKTRDNGVPNGNSTSEMWFFLKVYVGIGCVNSAITFARAFLFAYGGLKAAKYIYKELLTSITKARMLFFDTSPVGRILNRLSSDTYTVDDSLPLVVNILLAQFFSLLGTVAMTVYGIPAIGVILLPLIPMYYWLQRRYRLTSRELKRITSVSLSPLYNHFLETYRGLATIRAHRVMSRFEERNHDLLENYQKGQFCSLAVSSWLSIRLQLIGLTVIGGICAAAIVQHHYQLANPAFIGLAFSYSLSLMSTLSAVVNIFAETEREMIAIERIGEYFEQIEKEPDDNLVLEPPESWPLRGSVVFNNVCFRYRENLPEALKRVSFQIDAGERVAIVGRTGAGKSSLFVCLFRLAELSSGSVYIDGVNIRDVPLDRLRCSLSVIPQCAFIFSGTIRANMDPYGACSDDAIWKAIKLCNLESLIGTLGGLEAHMPNNRLSVGERQLFCIVRAILKNAKIVCLDEATSNVDRETDKRIQTVLRNAFPRSTVITIAHRIQTVIDSNRVLVMGEGEVLEFDNPNTLLQSRNSHFTRLVQSGLEDFA